MKISALVLLIGAAVSLSACQMSDPPSRGQAGVQTLGLGAQSAALNVQRINVAVPRSLVVSEENTRLPSADIVWHGEAAGDRRAQVAAIMNSAFARGTAGMHAGRPVTVDITVARFHALTPITRQSTGGKHALVYYMSLRDGVTGQQLTDPHKVNASVMGAGGAAAEAEEAAGRTQKVVITEALAASIQDELQRLQNRL